jgi:hypothetical protein
MTLLSGCFEEAEAPENPQEAKFWASLFLARALDKSPCTQFKAFFGFGFRQG